MGEGGREGQGRGEELGGTQAWTDLIICSVFLITMLQRAFQSNGQLMEAMGHGRWAVGRGPWAVGGGRGCGRWARSSSITRVMVPSATRGPPRLPGCLGALSPSGRGTSSVQSGWDWFRCSRLL